eukprot:Hpha_TRINITY_DN2137_c0_g1::TRINITY_DN2137_c0_g1_i1::g.42247::m.42247
MACAVICSLCGSGGELFCVECVERTLSVSRSQVQESAQRRRREWLGLKPGLRAISEHHADVCRRRGKAARLKELRARVGRLREERDICIRANEEAVVGLGALQTERTRLVASQGSWRRAAGGRLPDNRIAEAHATSLEEEVEGLRVERCRQILDHTPLQACRQSQQLRDISIGPCQGHCLPAVASAVSLCDANPNRLSSAAGALAAVVSQLADVLGCPVPYSMRVRGSRSYICVRREGAPPERVHSSSSSGARSRSSSAVVAGLAQVTDSLTTLWQRACAVSGSGQSGASQRTEWVQEMPGGVVELPLWLESCEDLRQRRSFLDACARLNSNIIALVHSQHVYIRPHRPPTLLSVSGGEVSLTVADCLATLHARRQETIGALRRRPLVNCGVEMRGQLRKQGESLTDVTLRLGVVGSGIVTGVMCCAGESACQFHVLGRFDTGTSSLSVSRSDAAGRKATPAEGHQCVLCRSPDFRFVGTFRSEDTSTLGVNGVLKGQWWAGKATGGILLRRVPASSDVSLADVPTLAEESTGLDFVNISSSPSASPIGQGPADLGGPWRRDSQLSAAAQSRGLPRVVSNESDWEMV